MQPELRGLVPAYELQVASYSGCDGHGSLGTVIVLLRLANRR
jgi:hypothetical protein